MAQVTDPLSGQQITLNGALFGRLASWVFMSGGGFMLMIGTLLESYALWPVRCAACRRWPPAAFACSKASSAASWPLTLLVAAPALVLLYVVEGVLGLINRFAQQLNVFSLSQSLKAVAAIWIIWIQLTVWCSSCRTTCCTRGGIVLQHLARALRS